MGLTSGRRGPRLPLASRIAHRLAPAPPPTLPERLVTVKRLFVAVFLTGALVFPSIVRAEERKPVRVYTNDDLERVSAFRGQTGVDSIPAFEAPEGPASASPQGSATARPAGPRHGSATEAYWRREAERVRTRVRALEARANELRLQIQREEQREHDRPLVLGRGRTSQARPPSTVPGLQAKLAAAEREARAVQDELEDRARRESALPGWLR